MHRLNAFNISFFALILCSASLIAFHESFCALTRAILKSFNTAVLLRYRKISNPPKRKQKNNNSVSLSGSTKQFINFINKFHPLINCVILLLNETELLFFVFALYIIYT